MAPFLLLPTDEDGYVSPTTDGETKNKCREGGLLAGHPPVDLPAPDLTAGVNGAPDK
jgi:hypothetical protein